jgi:hypothetical protein
MQTAAHLPVTQIMQTAAHLAVIRIIQTPTVHPTIQVDLI